MTDKRDIVTDHAVLCYLERVYGVDVKSLKRRIANATVEGRKAGADSQISDGVKYRLSKTGRVTTVHGILQPLSNRARRWRRRRK
ncbi:hypothetical protein KX928_12715 [Roseobacter sp. YSTF-M11]|uniref:Uncharacterized protein n=1 Tax=Roseobacter insulae TaxID=2859783 RepID=A0A9X1FWL0_9RHOB|nr:hypothetical protein [Roseobacter insulae]MBW4708647.1 hypothetical protein [Roseobacter insulae]